MSGLGRVIRSGVRRRRVQTAVIGLVSAAAVTASVLGVGLLVASRSPFDTAFRAQHGAHLSVQADPAAATEAQLTASAQATGVTAAAGPYPMVAVELSDDRMRIPTLTVVGRDRAARWTGSSWSRACGRGGPDRS